ncbi:MAG: hypothetical protein JNL25_01095 [Rhodospirillaceae bacterium]|nr:hypothetical protein [Rhodospirillaceae bacterium]
MTPQNTVPPLWLKLPYTLFLAVLVPVYWIDYGPTNFLYFCDVALFLALISLWSGSMLWASAAAIGILLPQAIWMADFLGSAIGLPVTGMTAYMFNSDLPLFTRFLSLFHFWLPLLLLYLVWQYGYDRRAIWLWWPLASALLVLCYLIAPPPPAPADNPGLPVNINYVYGLSDAAPQDWLPPLVYFLLLMAAMPTLIFWPTHWLLKRIMPPAR